MDFVAQTLSRRQEIERCGSDKDSEPYDRPLQIGALFIILTVSTGACAFPIIAARTPRLRIPLKFLFIVRHFGTGVLIATAFVYLLPEAFESLNDSCLPALWNEDFSAIPGAIALAAIFTITLIEMLLSPERKCCSMPVPHEQEAGFSYPPDQLITAPESGADPLGHFHSKSNKKTFADQVNERQAQDTSVIEDSASSKIDREAVVDQLSVQLSPDQQRKKLILQCVLLEVGILFHSVFVGMSLAVSKGSDLTVLLIAITFHQLFEGLALGARIATINWTSARAAQPWLMALAYGCTTPIGQALGIATSDLYDPASMTGLLLVGIMNAISAGLLTYTSLVNLLNQVFLSDASWRTLKGTKRVVAFSLVVLGAFLMSLIAAWA